MCKVGCLFGEGRCVDGDGCVQRVGCAQQPWLLNCLHSCTAVPSRRCAQTGVEYNPPPSRGTRGAQNAGGGSSRALPLLRRRFIPYPPPLLSSCATSASNPSKHSSALTRCCSHTASAASRQLLSPWRGCIAQSSSSSSSSSASPSSPPHSKSRARRPTNVPLLYPTPSSLHPLTLSVSFRTDSSALSLSAALSLPLSREGEEGDCSLQAQLRHRRGRHWRRGGYQGARSQPSPPHPRRVRGALHRGPCHHRARARPDRGGPLAAKGNVSCPSTPPSCLPSAHLPCDCSPAAVSLPSVPR